MERVVAKFDLRFDLLLSREDATLKPAPDLFLKVLDIIGGKPEQTAGVGDSTMDVRAAMASGCMPVGVLTGMGSRESLEAAGCRHVFQTLSEAAAFLAGL